MKKLLTLGLVLSAGLVLAGCTSSTPSTDDAVAPVVEATTGVAQTPVVEAPVVESTTGTVTTTVATGVEVSTGK